MANDDYYSILGVDRQAPEREVKRAYYALARDMHPDKAKSPEEGRENAERLATISKAYNVLKDPRKRAEYDAGHKPSANASPQGATTPPQAAPAAKSAGTPPTANSVAKGGSAPKSPNTGAATEAKVSSSEIAQQKVMMAQKAFVKGMEFLKQTDYKKALPFFEAAVSNDPESEPHYHMKLAICLVKTRGSFSRAVAAAERASEMDTYNMEFKFGLGEIYETVGITSKAVVVYNDILKWEPENDKAKLRLKLLAHAEQVKNPSLLAKVFPSLFGKK